jgi:multidrug efflux pump subunit AcrA (membrane-fusion protein)
MNRVVVLLSVVSLTAFGAEPAGGKLRFAKAREVKSSSKETVTGQLFPSRMLPMGFEVGGRLAASRVQKGELVKPGQLLGSLDTEIVDAQVLQAEAGVAQAEAAAGLAADVAARNEKLKAEGSRRRQASRSRRRSWPRRRPAARSTTCAPSSPAPSSTRPTRRVAWWAQATRCGSSCSSTRSW